MSEPLPQIDIPVATSRFNTPGGNGFVAWFMALRVSINVLAIEILNRAGIIAREHVDEKVIEDGFLTGVRATTSPGVALSITDLDGRRSWLEISDTGRPTDHAKTLIFEGNESPTTPMLESTGYLFAVVDEDGRISEMALGLDGRLAGPFPTRVIGESVTAATKLITAQPPIVAWGHSLVDAIGSFIGVVGTELNVAVSNQGIGGQGLASIAARQGGLPAVVVVPNDTLPASGPVTLTSVTPPPYTIATGVGTSSGPGSLAGIKGTLSRDNTTGVHTFTRAAAGNATWCPPGTPWVPDAAVQHRGSISIFFAVRNTVLFQPLATIMDQIRMMVKYQSAPVPRFLIMEEPPQVGEESGTANRAKLDAYNDAVRAEYPHAYVPVTSYLRGPAMAESGLTPTAQDQQDMANGLVPTSLRADALHWNTTGQQIAGKYVAKIIRQKGWVV